MSTRTLEQLQAMKRAGEKIACLTAYDASFAHWLDAADVDIALVGDSLGMVVQGQASTLPVTVEQMVYHAACVARGCRQAYRIVDMPYKSYDTPEHALTNARRLLQGGEAMMVKLEGGAPAQLAVIESLLGAGIPVCGHLGLLPQSVREPGGYRVQGREPEAAERILNQAQALERAGVGLLILEAVPAALGRRVSEALQIPVIGIGAGVHCDGQVLVLYDLLGITPGKRPRFSRDFLAGAGSVEAALRAYVQAVKAGEFPSAAESFN
ncbi:3-methyl-2-oxobutanoate hydroxymethyltransferase [Thiohalobacter sp. COW1]|uniref:3-methyl-2-oxobutanoate hydroxymethyltransferase n=1 Tax=Thiohalobacter thiocyanaticus TaxID=585455 RepID=A0A1Z4VTZ0_9GAMM|nr:MULTISPECIES: 3-methyl-2-oxobutanoate hydroxymethyltransferase [Thiohalobacter]BAZ94945.1 3-methyl-2-oxobutanoatehydroxymethyltransferase [Thiohalobacter thiocyanaticus]BCO33142.1 3-methyl-2-oxobutanoate hydroxymethyltransferase [Thiohalobacter sp. COW1]